MELRRLEGKRIRLINTENEEFEGVVGDYVFPEDNEPEGIEGIIVDYPIRGDGYRYRNPVLFNSPDIKSVEIIE